MEPLSTSGSVGTISAVIEIPLAGARTRRRCAQASTDAIRMRLEGKLLQADVLRKQLDEAATAQLHLARRRPSRWRRP